MTKDDKLELNGHPVVFTLWLVTEPGEGWKGSEYIGSYETLDELNKAINSTEKRDYWEFKVDLHDKVIDNG